MARENNTPDFSIPREELWQLYREQVHTLRRYFKKHRPSQVDDLMQAVYMEALTSHPAEAVRNPIHYLFGVAQHVLHSEYRRSSRESARWVKLDPKALEGVADERGLWTAGEDTGSALLQERMETALRQLPSQCQAAFLRAKRDGRSYREIADELQITTHTVKKYIMKALVHLRAELQS